MLKFQKTETSFCRWKSTGNNDINIFLLLENPCTFLLTKEKAWKRIFNTNSELSQNRTEKQVMPLKTTVNCLFNDTWCYLVMGCWLKKWPFPTNSCNGFFVSLMNSSTNRITSKDVFRTQWNIYNEAFLQK